MAREFKEWERNNIFRSHLAREIFTLDILERIHGDYARHKDDRGGKVIRESLEDNMVNFLEEVIDYIDYYLDDALYEEEGEDDYE